MLDEATIDRLIQGYDARKARGEAHFGANLFVKELEVELGRAPSPAEVEVLSARLDSYFAERAAEDGPLDDDELSARLDRYFAEEGLLDEDDAEEDDR